MNVITNKFTGTEHRVGDIDRDDLTSGRGEPKIYAGYSGCGIFVEGPLTRTKTTPTTKPCKVCFRKNNG